MGSTAGQPAFERESTFNLAHSMLICFLGIVSIHTKPLPRYLDAVACVAAPA
jgi:hypothetical protein